LFYYRFFLYLINQFVVDKTKRGANPKQIPSPGALAQGARMGKPMRRNRQQNLSCLAWLTAAAAAVCDIALGLYFGLADTPEN
jgi:hypothetical protein